MYCYDIKYSGEKDSLPNIYAMVGLEGFVEAFKSYDKREELDINGSFAEDGVIEEIICSRGDDIADRIACDNLSFTMIEPLTDPIEMYYKDAEPNGKTTIQKFSKIISSYKTRRCQNITFTLADDNVITIEGYKTKSLGIAQIYANGRDTDTTNSQIHQLKNRR